MQTQPLLTFKSHIDGKNADVSIYPDRIEWDKPGRVTATRLMGGLATAGVSLMKTGVRTGGDTEMIPIKAMSSVNTGKDGMRFHKVIVTCAGNVVEFRVDKGDSDRVKMMLTQLILGSHPSQALGHLPPPPAAAAPTFAPPSARPAPTTSVSEELVKLAGLRDAGVLTGEEFAAAKARLLG